MSKHRLVSLGDSLTQGFMSGAIYATDMSYPALIARELGLSPQEFRFPNFRGFGGLPANIEYYLRRLEERYGSNIDRLEAAGAAFRLRSWMDQTEDHWERGGGVVPSPTAGPFHNLGSWGMTVDDALYLTADICRQKCKHWMNDNPLIQVPEKAFYRTALKVTNPGLSLEEMHNTTLARARELAADGGIENLLVWLGANNALGTVCFLKIKPTTDKVVDDPMGSREEFNLWLPEHFAHFYETLAQELEALNAERVFLATVPHITIAPIARGVGSETCHRLACDERYFKYYTYFWISDEEFDPNRHPHLTGEEAQYIDQVIDQYNETIKAMARKRCGQHWHVVDLCDMLERMAHRRYRERGVVPLGGYYEFPKGWVNVFEKRGLKLPTTEYMRTSGGKRVKGGLVSLDGVHPTTMTYGLVAQEFIRVMQCKDVKFYNAHSGQERPEAVELDFESLLRRDSLLSSPPGLLDDAHRTLAWLEDWAGLSQIVKMIA